MPFEKYLKLEIITEGAKSYSAQDKMQYLKVNNYTIRPLICYESIFSDHPVDEERRADFIVNVTNDNWHENSFEPYQHFSMSKFRAIEQGLPMVRVAMSGISAVIDSYGRVVNQIAMNEEGVISTLLPQPLKQPNLFSIAVEKIMIGCFAFLVLLALSTRKIFLKNKSTERLSL
jgi:apolipoprotein N-acyltransferase